MVGGDVDAHGAIGPPPGAGAPSAAGAVVGPRRRGTYPDDGRPPPGKQSTRDPQRHRHVHLRPGPTRDDLLIRQRAWLGSTRSPRTARATGRSVACATRPVHVREIIRRPPRGAAASSVGRRSATCSLLRTPGGRGAGSKPLEPTSTIGTPRPRGPHRALGASAHGRRERDLLRRQRREGPQRVVYLYQSGWACPTSPTTASRSTQGPRGLQAARRAHAPLGGWSTDGPRP